MSLERTANTGDTRGENQNVIILVRESQLNLEIILLTQHQPRPLWFPLIPPPILHPIRSRRSSRGAGILTTRGLSTNHDFMFPVENISQYSNNILVVTIIIVLL